MTLTRWTVAAPASIGLLEHEGGVSPPLGPAHCHQKEEQAGNGDQMAQVADHNWQTYFFHISVMLQVVRSVDVVVAIVGGGVGGGAGVKGGGGGGGGVIF